MPWPQVITPSSVTQICCIFCALLFMLLEHVYLIYYALCARNICTMTMKPRRIWKIVYMYRGEIYLQKQYI